MSIVGIFSISWLAKIWWVVSVSWSELGKAQPQLVISIFGPSVMLTWNGLLENALTIFESATGAEKTYKKTQVGGVQLGITLDLKFSFSPPQGIGLTL